MNRIFAALGMMLFGVLSAAAPLAYAQAQSYPSKPLSLVVPFSPGAGTDLIARRLAETLSPRLGQPVLVDNRVGAAGVIGTTFVAKAPADGYTLLFIPGSFSFAHLVSAGGYDPLNDFVPIIEVGKTPVYLVTHANSGFKTFKEVVAAAKTRKLEYGSAGPGSILHIIGEVVNKETGVSFTHIPFKGVAPAVTAVLGGHIPFSYGSLSTIKPHMASGKLVPLAITSRERTQFTPDVPTLYELGYKGIDLASWYGLFGPKGMSADAVRMLNAHLNEILKMHEVIDSMALQGSSPVGGPPQTLGKTNATDVALFGRIIKELNIKAD